MDGAHRRRHLLQPEPNLKRTMMKKLATAAAIAALLGVSASAAAFWGGPWGNNGYGNNNNNLRPPNLASRRYGSPRAAHPHQHRIFCWRRPLRLIPACLCGRILQRHGLPLRSSPNGGQIEGNPRRDGRHAADSIALFSTWRGAHHRGIGL